MEECPRDGGLSEGSRRIQNFHTAMIFKIIKVRRHYFFTATRSCKLYSKISSHLESIAIFLCPDTVRDIELSEPAGFKATVT